MKKIICCKKELELQKGKSNKGDYVYYHCNICNKKGAGKNEQQAFENYMKDETIITKELSIIPKDQKQIANWTTSNMPALLNQSAQFIDKPATKRMIEKNIRYVSNLTGGSWDKIWNTDEGKESITHALSESLYHAATLPEMGSIVPFGKTAEFIPSVECYKFALESGKNAPLTDIDIMLIHENDQRELSNENGNFKINLNYGIPRGEIIAVAVVATRTDTNKIIGEVYDVERLLEKAKHHSPSYKNYIIDKEDFKRMEVEGKLKTDNSGRKYYEKKIEYTKDGKKNSFTKDIYEHDIINPYDGPDRPEMLKKSAGKTFFRPFMKVRNASAMADEWNEDDKINDDISREKAADNILNTAINQFENIKDAEVIIEPNKTETNQPDKSTVKPVKKETKKNNGGLYDGNEGTI